MRIATIAAALAIASLAACGDQTPQPRVDQAPQPRVDSQPAAGGSSGVTSSATGAASKEDKREGANPQQQQVDPKQKEQRRDFEMRGDQAGPTSPETQPKN
jgi:hypothetical protein